MSNYDYIGTWKILFEYSELQHHTMRYLLTIFIEKDKEYFYLIDDRDKIGDIIKMPSYIKEDWVRYNKKELDFNIIDKYIKDLKKVEMSETSSLLNDLINIKREIQLNKII